MTSLPASHPAQRQQLITLAKKGVAHPHTPCALLPKCRGNLTLSLRRRPLRLFHYMIAQTPLRLKQSSQVRFQAELLPANEGSTTMLCRISPPVEHAFWLPRLPSTPLQPFHKRFTRLSTLPASLCSPSPEKGQVCSLM